MANTVDERIVEAKFDASDFEKGVDKTIKKLDELKDSLNLKDAGKTITDFASDAEKGVEKANSALERLSDRLTTFKGMIKQQVLGGLAQEVSNVFLTIERSVLRFTKSISSDQIGAGMTKYTEILNSVRTMTAAGIGEGIAYDKIKRLADYSDQTSYSLSQMTSGMSKLVAAGMDVDKAEKSMEGLANMAASAGVNIYEANRAFMNFSQAYSSGKMRIQDWMSFESLNMATEGVMKVFMMAGEQVGTLTKSVDKNGKEIYKTSNKINKAIKGNKAVATSGFRDTLSYGWLDKKTMEQATAVLSYFEDLQVDLNTLSDTQLKEFATRAFQAAKEARSFADVMGTVKDVVATGWATTFELIFGKLGEATEFFTWLSDSKLANVIYSIGEFRNTVLKTWGEAYQGYNDEEESLIGGIFKKGKTGRDMLIESLHNIDDLIGAIHEGLQGLFPTSWNRVIQKNLSFPETLGRRLGYMTKSLRDTTRELRAIFTNPVFDEDGKKIIGYELTEKWKERFQTIGNVISSVIGIFTDFGHTVSTVIHNIFEKSQPLLDAVIDSIGKIQPVVDAVRSAVNKMLAPIVNASGDDQFFKDLKDSFDNLMTVIQPVIDLLSPLIELLGDIGAFFVDIGLSTITMNVNLFAEALGLVLEILGIGSAQSKRGEGVIQGWAEDIANFGAACKEALGAIGTFFTALFDDIRKIFGLGEKTEGKKGGAFEHIKEFFDTNEFVQTVKDKVHEAIEKVREFVKSIPDKVKNIWKSIDEFIFGKKVQKTQTISGGKGTSKLMGDMTERVKSGFSLWLSNTIQSVKDWMKKVPGKITDLWKGIVEFLFGKEAQKPTINSNTGEAEMYKYRIKEGFSKWLSDTVQKIKDWFAGIPAKITDLWQSIVKFFFGEDVIKKVEDPETGEIKEMTDHIEGGFEKWFNATYVKIKEWITGGESGEGGLKEKIKDLWQEVVKFFFGEDVVEEVKDPETGEISQKVTGHIEAGIKTWFDTTIEKVKTYFTGGEEGSFKSDIANLWQTIVKFFFGEDVTEEIRDPETNEITHKPGDHIEAGIKTWFNDTIEKVKNYFTTDEEGGFKSNIANLWQSIIKFFFGEEAAAEVQGLEASEISAIFLERVKDGIKTWFNETVEKVKTYFTTDEEGGFKSGIVNLWKKIVDFFFGKEVVTEVENPETGETEEVTNRVKEGFSEWLDNTITKVSYWAKGIPSKISNLWQTVLDYIFGKNQTPFNQQMYDNLTRYAGPSVADAYKKQWEKENWLSSLVTKVGDAIGNVFSGLPGYIAEKINFRAGLLKQLLESATGWLSNRNDQREAAENIGENAENLLDMSAEDAAKKISDNNEPGPFLTAVMSVGQTMGGLITETIPELLKEAFEYVKGEKSGWWNTLKTVLNLDGFDWSSVALGAENIGNKIAGYIESIPETIRNTVSSIKSVIDYNPLLERARKEIESQYTDQNGNIIDPKRYEEALEKAEKEFEGKSWLWDTVKSIGGAIGDAFLQLGPDILDGLNGALDWLGNGLTKITGFMDEAHTKGQNIPEAIAERLADDTVSEEDKSLLTSIQKLGETIKRIIVEVIPGFIKSAFDEVTTGIPKMLSGLFGGDSENGSSLIDDLVKTITGENVSTKDLSESEGAFKDTMSDIQDVYTDRLRTVSSVLDNVQSETDKEINRRRRTAVLDDLVKVYDDLTWHNVFNGKKDAFDFDDEKQLKEFEAIRLELQEIINEYGSMTDEFVEVDERAAKYINPSKNAISGVTGLLGTFGTLIEGIGNLASSDLAMYATIIIGVGFVLHSLKEVLSLTDEVEGFGYTAKWQGLKAAIYGVIAMIGWISYLASEAAANPDDKRLQDTLDALDTIVGFIERIGTVITTIAGLNLGGSIFDMVGSIFNAKAAKNTAKAVGKTGNFFSNAGATLVSGLSKLAMIAFGSDIIGGGFESLSESLGAVFSNIGLGIDNMMTFLDPAIEKMAGIGKNVADAITAVEEIQKLITKLNDLTGVIDLSKALNADLWGGPQPEDAGEKWDESATNVIGKLQTRMGVLFTIGSMMSSLAKGIEDFSKIENPTEKVQAISDFIASDDNVFFDFISNLSSTVTNALQMGTPRGMASMSDTAIALEMLANALSIFSIGISDITPENVKGLDETLDVFNKLATILGDNPELNQSVWQKVFSGDNSFSHFGQEISSFGGNMRQFFNNIKHLSGVSESEIANTRKRIDLVITIAKGMAEAANLVGTSYGGAAEIETIGRLLNEGYGSNIGSFISAVNSSLSETVDLDRIQIISTGVQAIAELARGVGTLGQGFMGAPDKIPEFVSKFLKAIADNFVGDNDLFTAGVTAGNNLDLGLAQGIRDYSGAAIEAAEELASQIAGIIPRKWLIKSPSRLFAQFGAYLDQGLEKGILDEADRPLSAVGDLTEDMTAQVQSMLDDPSASGDMKKIGSKYLMGVKLTAEEELKLVKQVYANLVNEMGVDADKAKYRKQIEESFGWVGQEAFQVLRAQTKADEAKINIWAAKEALSKKNIFEKISMFFDATKDVRYKAAHPYANAFEGSVESTIDQIEQGVINVATKALDNAKEKLEEIGSEYAPEFTTALFGSGLMDKNLLELSGEDLVPHLYDFISAALKDAGHYTDNPYASMVLGMMGDAVNIIRNGQDATGEEIFTSIMGSVLTNMKNYSDNSYVDFACEMMGGVLQNVKAESEKTGESMLDVFLAGLSETGNEAKGAGLDLLMRALFGGEDLTANGYAPILDTIRSLVLEDMGDINPTITPVVDMSNVEAAAKEMGLLGFSNNASSFFGFSTSGLNTNAQGANPAIYKPEVPTTPKDYESLFSSVISQLGTMANNINNIPAAIAGMSLTLDSGALVGGIIGGVDTELGRRGFYAGRER